MSQTPDSPHYNGFEYIRETIYLEFVVDGVNRIIVHDGVYMHVMRHHIFPRIPDLAQAMMSVAHQGMLSPGNITLASSHSCTQDLTMSPYISLRHISPYTTTFFPTVPLQSKRDSCILHHYLQILRPEAIISEFQEVESHYHTLSLLFCSSHKILRLNLNNQL
jgi:hypothetical protein